MTKHEDKKDFSKKMKCVTIKVEDDIGCAHYTERSVFDGFTFDITMTVDTPRCDCDGDWDFDYEKYEKEFYDKIDEKELDYQEKELKEIKKHD
jgi:hypothetical protein